MCYLGFLKRICIFSKSEIRKKGKDNSTLQKYKHFLLLPQSGIICEGLRDATTIETVIGEKRQNIAPASGSS